MIAWNITRWRRIFKICNGEKRNAEIGLPTSSKPQQKCARVQLFRDSYTASEIFFSDFCVSFFAVAYFKNTTPSGDIPRDHYQQHCQYRLRGLRYIACGQVASSIINRSMQMSNRWRHILPHSCFIMNIELQNVIIFLFWKWVS